MRFMVTVLLCTAAFAQSPDPSSLLGRQSEEFQEHRSYEYTQDMSMKIGMPGMNMPAVSYSTLIKAVNPGKQRMEATIPALGTMLTISNGKQTWMYMPSTNQYTRTAATEADAQDVLRGGMDSAMPDSKEMVAGAKIRGSETIEADGVQHECWVLESHMDKLAIPEQKSEMQDVTYSWWIDKQNGVQWKTSFSAKITTNAAMPAMTTSMTMTTRALKFDEDLPDSLFEFTPPEGAKETEELLPGLPGGGGGGGSSAPKPAKPAAPGTGTEPAAYIPELVPTNDVPPVYSAQARAQKLEGFVTVLVTIDASGAVTKAEALTGHDALRAPAANAVKQWTFHPVLRDGHPVAAYTDAIVGFPPGEKMSPDGAKAALRLTDDLKAEQRMQALQQQFPRSPQQILADTEEQTRELTGLERLDALSELGREAVDAGELAKAKSYATELLEGNAQIEGSAAYDANTVLGLVALRQGSVSQARQYLLEAGKAPAAGQIAPFGPDFTLARELLAKGEKDAVLEFLASCKGFWKEGAEQVDMMIASVKQNGTF